MLIVGVVDEAADKGLGPDILIQIIPFIFPRALMFAMPATCLFSVCVVFGRLAADNELIAIQSMGLPKSVIVVPTLGVAFLLSLFAVWVNDVSFAWSYWGIEKVVLESSDKIVYSMLQNEGSFRSDNFTIEVQGVEGKKLVQPIIVFSKSKNDNIRMVAHEAYLHTKPESHSLEFTMNRGTVDYDGKTDMHYEFDHDTQLLPLKSPEEVAKATGNPSHLYLSQIGGEIRKQAKELEQLRDRNATRACRQMISGDLIGLTNSDWDERLEELEDAEARLGRLKVVPHRRWANGFSCFAFAVIGIPVALRLRSANYARTFGVCFMPILFVYYPLFMLGLTGAKEGTMPPYAAWLGNVACITIGAFLMYREFKR